MGLCSVPLITSDKNLWAPWTTLLELPFGFLIKISQNVTLGIDTELFILHKTKNSWWPERKRSTSTEKTRVGPRFFFFLDPQGVKTLGWRNYHITAFSFPWHYLPVVHVTKVTCFVQVRLRIEVHSEMRLYPFPIWPYLHQYPARKITEVMSQSTYRCREVILIISYEI